jgi:hypothetical protein
MVFDDELTSSQVSNGLLAETSLDGPSPASPRLPHRGSPVPNSTAAAAAAAAAAARAVAPKAAIAVDSSDEEGDSHRLTPPQPVKRAAAPARSAHGEDESDKDRDDRSLGRGYGTKGSALASDELAATTVGRSIEGQSSREKDSSPRAASTAASKPADSPADKRSSSTLAAQATEHSPSTRRDSRPTVLPESAPDMRLTAAANRPDTREDPGSTAADMRTAATVKAQGSGRHPRTESVASLSSSEDESASEHSDDRVTPNATRSSLAVPASRSANGQTLANSDGIKPARLAEPSVLTSESRASSQVSPASAVGARSPAAGTTTPSSSAAAGMAQATGRAMPPGRPALSAGERKRVMVSRNGSPLGLRCASCLYIDKDTTYKRERERESVCVYVCASCCFGPPLIVQRCGRDAVTA